MGDGPAAPMLRWLLVGYGSGVLTMLYLVLSDVDEGYQAVGVVFAALLFINPILVGGLVAAVAPAGHRLLGALSLVALFPAAIYLQLRFEAGDWGFVAIWAVLIGVVMAPIGASTWFNAQGR